MYTRVQTLEIIEVIDSLSPVLSRLSIQSTSHSTTVTETESLEATEPR